jgi:hypothetical protein
VVDTWGHRQAKVYMMTMLTKSRWWSSKSSGGSRRLGGRAVEDAGDTCRVVGDAYGSSMLLASSLVGWASKTTGWTVSGFGPQNTGAVLAGIEGGMWRYREACVEAKLSHEGRVAIGYASILSWTITPSGSSGSAQNI